MCKRSYTLLSRFNSTQAINITYYLFVFAQYTKRDADSKNLFTTFAIGISALKIFYSNNIYMYNLTDNRSTHSFIKLFKKFLEYNSFNCAMYRKLPQVWDANPRNIFPEIISFIKLWQTNTSLNLKYVPFYDNKHFCCKIAD